MSADRHDRTQAFQLANRTKRCPDCRGPLVYNHDVYCPGPVQRIADPPVRDEPECDCPAGAWHLPDCELVA